MPASRSRASMNGRGFQSNQIVTKSVIRFLNPAPIGNRISLDILKRSSGVAGALRFSGSPRTLNHSGASVRERPRHPGLLVFRYLSGTNQCSYKLLNFSGFHWERGIDHSITKGVSRTCNSLLFLKMFQVFQPAHSANYFAINGHRI